MLTLYLQVAVAPVVVHIGEPSCLAADGHRICVHSPVGLLLNMELHEACMDFLSSCLEIHRSQRDLAKISKLQSQHVMHIGMEELYHTTLYGGYITKPQCQRHSMQHALPLSNSDGSSAKQQQMIT